MNTFVEHGKTRTTNVINFWPTITNNKSEKWRWYTICQAHIRRSISISLERYALTWKAVWELFNHVNIESYVSVDSETSQIALMELDISTNQNDQLEKQFIDWSIKTKGKFNFDSCMQASRNHSVRVSNNCFLDLEVRYRKVNWERNVWWFEKFYGDIG